MYAKLAGALFILAMAGVLPAHADQAAHSCMITIDVSRWSPGACTVEDQGNALTVKWPGAGTIKYFARLEVSGNEADVSWSTIRGDTTDTQALGHMSKTGDCWSNDKAQICFAIDAPAVAAQVFDDPYEDYGSDGEEADAAPIGNASSFRGIQLGMTKAQIEAALPASFTLSRRNDKIEGEFYADALVLGAAPNRELFGSLFILDKNDEVCGEFAFSGATVNKMRLSKCFFGTDTNISLEDFAKQIIANYDIADGMSYDGSVSSGSVSRTRYAEYTGVRGATSERFTAALSESSSGSSHLLTLTVEKIPNINFN